MSTHTSRLAAPDAELHVRLARARALQRTLAAASAVDCRATRLVRVT